MARFSVCGGDDGEGSSNDRSRKRQRLPSIDEDEEDAEDSDAGSSGEEDEEESLIPHRGEEGNCRGRRMESEDLASTSDDSSREVLLMEVERRFGNSVVNSQRDSPLSLTLLDPDVLDCPICCEALKIPIFQCDNGHVACSVCCTKVRNRCPSCTLPIGYIRCRAMEKVIEASRVSCPNAKYGCKENMLYGNRFSHEKLCVFAPCSCPVRNCNYFGYHKDLNNHVRDKHKDDLVSFVWDKSLSISFHVREDTTILQEENDGEVIVIKAFKGLHVVYVTVSCIAPSAPGVGKLSCHLVNRAADSSLRQGFNVKNIRKVGNEQPEDGFVVIPSYMLAGDVLISIGLVRISFNA